MSNRSYPLEYIALGLILHEAKHGYSLYQDFEATFKPIWRAGRSKFYAKLNEIEAQGWVEAARQQQDNRPTRKILSITETGRELFFEWLQAPVTPLRNVRVELLAKLQLFELLQIHGAEDLLVAQIHSCQERLDAFEVLIDAYASKNDLPYLAY